MPDFINGEFLLIDKPKYWTSFDLVNKVKSEIRKKLQVKIKVGHAGTLDPLASGLMIICTGRATKMIEKFQDLNKEYVARIQLGATTPSFDLETEVDKIYDYKHITEEQLKDTVKYFTGRLDQVPPIFSAKFVDGKRAYSLARKGKEIKLESKEVTIYEMNITEFNLPVIELRVLCSKGTYIRSLARDIGEKLNSGAHLIGLKRTAIGDYKLENALNVSEMTNYIHM